MFATCTISTVPRRVFGSIAALIRWSVMIGTYSMPCVPATSRRTGPDEAPWMIVNGIVVPVSPGAGRHLDRPARDRAWRRRDGSDRERRLGGSLDDEEECGPEHETASLRPRVSFYTNRKTKPEVSFRRRQPVRHVEPAHVDVDALPDAETERAVDGERRARKFRHDGAVRAEDDSAVPTSTLRMFLTASGPFCGANAPGGPVEDRRDAVRLVRDDRGLSVPPADERDRSDRLAGASSDRPPRNTPYSSVLLSGNRKISASTTKLPRPW